MKYSIESEIVSDQTNEINTIGTSIERMKVPNGWIVERIIICKDNSPSSSMCFVPDKNHEWILSEEK